MSENKKKSTEEPKKVTDTGFHRLQSKWTLWNDKKMAKKENHNYDDYNRNLKKLGSFDTLEGFWRHYSWLKSPDDLPRDTDFYCFRNQHVPAWETFPTGGCWIVKVRKKNGVISRLWEELLFGAVGELFDNADVMGVSISVRVRDDNLSVWNKTSDPAINIAIGERIKDLLNLDESTTMHYQECQKAMEYGSSFRHAKAYVFAAAQHFTQEQPSFQQYTPATTTSDTTEAQAPEAEASASS